eukprot:gene33911-41036_t
MGPRVKSPQGQCSLHLTKENAASLLDRYYQMNAPSCSEGWADKYITFHQESILAQESAKFLVFYPNLSGLADRIIGIVSSCMFAMLTNRVFQIAHRTSLISLQSVFVSQHIDWQRSATDPAWILECMKFNASDRYCNSSNALSDQHYFPLNTLEKLYLLEMFRSQDIGSLLGGESQTTFIAINRGLSMFMFENEHYADQLKNNWLLTPETAFGCIFDLLFRPKPEIFLRIPDTFMQVMKLKENPKKHLLIGIQIRVGDHVFIQDSVKFEEFQAFFDCARQIEKFTMPLGYVEAKWLLVTDSHSLRKDAVKKYGDKVITSLNAKIEHTAKDYCSLAGDCAVSTEGFETAAAEWWLLSMSSYFVISEYSGFGRSASMIGFKGRAVYTIPPFLAKESVTCDRDSVTDIEDLPYAWSGV